MLKPILTSAILAAGVAFGGMAAASADTMEPVAPLSATPPAEAQPADPGLVNTAYECGPYGCGWMPDYGADYGYGAIAAPYMAPAAPISDCHWHRGALGNWHQRC